MISKYKNNGVVWIDLVSPSEDEILYILDEYQISDNIKKEIESDSKEHKTMLEDETLFTILRLPMPDENDVLNKIIIIKNNNYVITIHDQPLNSIKQFSSELELDMSIPSESNIRNQELLFANLLRNMFTGLHDKVLSKDLIINSLKSKNNNLTKRCRFHFVFNLILLIILILLLTIWH